MLNSISVLAALAGLTAAQFPPRPSGLTVLKSKINENVTISFKEPGICETSPGVKSYAGYVHLPPGFLDGETQDYPVNMFFWFFEARKAPERAPLAIWINGGPGSSSMMGLLEENGPCFVAEDGRSTYLNEWSWNREVNMLYLDQPTQVGFSYDVATNCSSRPRHSEEEDGGYGYQLVPEDFSDGGMLPQLNLTHRVGTFASQNKSQTASSTAQAAHAFWHFAQTWFVEFPHYRPADDRISLWAESYGGHYGPAFARFLQEQNDKIANGSAGDGEKNAQYIHLDTLGIVNGLVDMVLQAEGYIEFPYDNTYGIQLFNQSVYDELVHNWTRPGGCRDQVVGCRDAIRDELGGRGETTVLLSSLSAEKSLADVCDSIGDECQTMGVQTYRQLADARGWYDIGHPQNDPFPAPTMHGYLTEESVLAALGVPVNFTTHSMAVSERFQESYDIILGGFLDSLAYLLDAGVKVHMMYGDRDYACNWIGGEKASLGVPYGRADEFARTGYSPLLTPDGFSGWTRQLANFSFTRVYQSGHEVPAYQPAAAYEIFMRATFNRDIPTGLLPVTHNYATVGPHDTRIFKNTPPEMPKPRCHILQPGSCTPDVWAKLEAGRVVVKDWFVVDVLPDEDSNSIRVSSEGGSKGQEAIDEL